MARRARRTVKAKQVLPPPISRARYDGQINSGRTMRTRRALPRVRDSYGNVPKSNEAASQAMLEGTLDEQRWWGRPIDALDEDSEEEDETKHRKDGEGDGQEYENSKSYEQQKLIEGQTFLETPDPAILRTQEYLHPSTSFDQMEMARTDSFRASNNTNARKISAPRISGVLKGTECSQSFQVDSLGSPTPLQPSVILELDQHADASSISTRTRPRSSTLRAASKSQNTGTMAIPPYGDSWAHPFNREAFNFAEYDCKPATDGDKTGSNPAGEDK